jgi:RND family efflux transporter MFP subunit
MSSNQNPNIPSLPETGGSPHRESSTVMRILKLILGLAVVSGAVALSVHWMTNRPRAHRRTPKKEARLVETLEVTAGTHRITVHAMGTVVPVEEVRMVARVGGQLTSVNPDLIPGGHLKKGEVLATVEQADYRLAVEQARAALQQSELTCEERKLAIEQQTSQVAQAEKNLILEKAQQEVARSEYELLVGEDEPEEKQLALAESRAGQPDFGQDLGDPAYRALGSAVTASERELILRQPQINAAEAALAAARAGKDQAKAAHRSSLAARDKAQTALDQAQLNLKWTTIESPFDAVVREKHVGVGSYVSQGNPVATLVNTNAYWVMISVPVDRLKWVHAATKDRPGSKVCIYHEAAWGPGECREGRVKRIEPGIEQTGRMARLVVEVNDPRSVREENADSPVLMLDAYVRAEIEGRELKDAIRVPRTALREGERVWVKGRDKTLKVRPVQIAASDPDHVYVTEGLETGDHLITSDIPTPVEGMKLREETD